MTISSKTTQDILEVLVKHVPRPILDKILEDLIKIDGNSSFCQSVLKLKADLAG